MTQPFSESHFLLIPSISMHFCESSALLVGKSFKRQLQNNSLLCEYLTLYQAVVGLWVEDNNKRIILKLKVRHVEEASNQLMQGYIILKITYPI